jgi:hypothetical protein
MSASVIASSPSLRRVFLSVTTRCRWVTQWGAGLTGHQLRMMAVASLRESLQFCDAALWS